MRVGTFRMNWGVGSGFLVVERWCIIGWNGGFGG